MKILAIDTSTKFLCLGIWDGIKIYEYNLEVERKLSDLLSITIKRTLAASGQLIKDIDYFACGLGPGSFTGIRIGLAAIKGLSWALNKPVIGISTLDILAKDVRNSDNPIVPIIDAKRSLVYTSIFKNRNGCLKKILPYALSNEKELLRQVKPNSIILGDAVSLYKERLMRDIKGVTILDKDYWYPKAHNIISLALERIKDKKFSNAFDIKPIYLYPKECQIRTIK